MNPVKRLWGRCFRFPTVGVLTDVRSGLFQFLNVLQDVVVKSILPVEAAVAHRSNALGGFRFEGAHNDSQRSSGLFWSRFEDQNSVQVIWHDDPGVQTNPRIAPRNPLPFAGYDLAIGRARHLPSCHLTQAPIAPIGTDRHEIHAGPTIIPTWQTRGRNPITIPKQRSRMARHRKARYHPSPQPLLPANAPPFRRDAPDDEVQPVKATNGGASLAGHQRFAKAGYLTLPFPSPLRP